MNWLRVDSSVLAAAAYLPTNRVLYLKFLSGEVYRYFEFPLELYREFLAADSKGRYYSNHIRNQFRYEQISRTHEAGE